MSDVLKKLVVEVGGVARYIDLTPEEIEQRAVDVQAAAIEKAERDAEAQAKADAKLSAQAKLASLGLSSEEIAALG